MDRIGRLKREGMSNEDIFAIYTEYIKDSIEKDLLKIYEREARLVDSEEPWIFELGKK